MIEKLEKMNVTNEVMGDLIDQIISNEIAAGEKFPSENEMADKFGVSRLTVRAALQKMETLGLIDIKVGKGSYVKERNFPNIMESHSDLLSQYKGLYPHVKEIRITIEQACVEHAIDRATDEDIEELNVLADKLMTAALENDLALFNKIDYDFHYKICQISKNPLYEMVYATLKGLIYQVSALHVNYMIENMDDGLIKAAKIHKNLVDLIVARDKKSAVKNVANLLFVSHDIKHADIHLE